LTRFDERLVHGTYWRRLAAGVLAPGSGSLRREIALTGLDDAALWPLGASLGRPLPRGRRYARATLTAHLGALFGGEPPVLWEGRHTATYRFEAPASGWGGPARSAGALRGAVQGPLHWAVYGLHDVFGLEAPHLRRVLELIERRPNGAASLADAGYGFERDCAEVPSLP